jgi:hypothetical protein
MSGASMTPLRRGVQYGLGYLLGAFAALIVEVVLVIGLESLFRRSLGISSVALLPVPLLAGVPVARWIGPLDWAAILSGQSKAARAARPPKPKGPWNFKLVGTLALFWFLSLLAIIALFGPFGLADNTSTFIRVAKILVTTVVIVGIGAFLLRKELTKVMSGTPGKPSGK